MPILLRNNADMIDEENKKLTGKFRYLEKKNVEQSTKDDLPPKNIEIKTSYNIDKLFEELRNKITNVINEYQRGVPPEKKEGLSAVILAFNVLISYLKNIVFGNNINAKDINAIGNKLKELVPLVKQLLTIAVDNDYADTEYIKMMLNKIESGDLSPIPIISISRDPLNNQVLKMARDSKNNLSTYLLNKEYEALNANQKKLVNKTIQEYNSKLNKIISSTPKVKDAKLREYLLIITDINNELLKNFGIVSAPVIHASSSSSSAAAAPSSSISRVVLSDDEIKQRVLKEKLDELSSMTDEQLINLGSTKKLQKEYRKMDKVLLIQTLLNKWVNSPEFTRKFDELKAFEEKEEKPIGSGYKSLNTNKKEVYRRANLDDGFHRYLIDFNPVLPMFYDEKQDKFLQYNDEENDLFS